MLPESSSSHNNTNKDGDNMPEQAQSIKTKFCLNVAHNLTQIMLGGVVISAMIIPNLSDLTSSYAQHIILCTLGYCILMTEATLVFSPFGWASNMKYKHKRLIHLTLQILGSIFVIIGSAIMMAHVKHNFSTCHGIFGILAMLLTVLTLLGGLLSLIFPKQMCNKFMKIAHAYVGAATICLAFISLIFAFHTYYRRVLGDGNANFAIVLTVLSLIGSLLMASIRNYKRMFNK